MKKDIYLGCTTILGILTAGIIASGMFVPWLCTALRIILGLLWLMCAIVSHKKYREIKESIPVKQPSHPLIMIETAVVALISAGILVLPPVPLVVKAIIAGLGIMRLFRIPIRKFSYTEGENTK